MPLDLAISLDFFNFEQSILTGYLVFPIQPESIKRWLTQGGLSYSSISGQEIEEYSYLRSDKSKEVYLPNPLIKQRSDNKNLIKGKLKCTSYLKIVYPTPIRELLIKHRYWLRDNAWGFEKKLALSESDFYRTLLCGCLLTRQSEGPLDSRILSLDAVNNFQKSLRYSVLEQIMHHNNSHFYRGGVIARELIDLCRPGLVLPVGLSVLEGTGGRFYELPPSYPPVITY